MEKPLTYISPEDRLAHALEAVGKADFPSAIALLEELVLEDGANASAWSQLGVCYLETQRPADAMEALRAPSPRHLTKPMFITCSATPVAASANSTGPRAAIAALWSSTPITPKRKNS